MVRLSIILVFLGIAWGSPTVARSQSVGGAILLKNDRMLVGQVESRGNLYSVAIAKDSRVSIPTDQVQYVGNDPLEVYDFKVSSTKRWDIGDHFQMTRWCLLNDLLDQATYHFQEVTKIRADHPRVKQLGIELQKKLLEQPEFRNYLGLAPITGSENRREQGNLSSSQNNGVVTASATLEHTAMHPEIAAVFSARIQPILLNRCSQAACHGVRSQNGLTLMEPYDRAFARISSQNLQGVLAQVTHHSDVISPLLKYATTAHGIQREPAISLTESQLLMELSSWVQQVQNPVVTAIGTEYAAAGSPQMRSNQTPQFVPYSPAVALVPVSPGANRLRQVPRPEGGFPNNDTPTMAEIDALDAQLKQMMGEPGNLPRGNTDPNTPASNVRQPSGEDPFDPEEFNKQSRG